MYSLAAALALTRVSVPSTGSGKESQMIIVSMNYNFKRMNIIVLILR